MRNINTGIKVAECLLPKVPVRVYCAPCGGLGRLRLGSFGVGACSRNALGFAWRKERARGVRGGFRFVRYKWGSFDPGSARLRPIHIAVRPNAQGGLPTP